MSNLNELIQLYGLDNLPDWLRKERELKRWREIMAQQKYVQDDLPYFQQQDDREAFIRHKEALAKRWFGYYRKCKDQQKKLKLIDQYNYLATMKQR